MKFLNIALLTLAASLATTAAHAEVLHGDAFVTAMNGNTLHGKAADGAEFHVFFLPGGEVTYEDTAGKREYGTWAFDNEGDVCVTWVQPEKKEARCYRVNANGPVVTWEGKPGTPQGGLHGEALPLDLTKAP